MYPQMGDKIDMEELVELYTSRREKLKITVSLLTLKKLEKIRELLVIEDAKGKNTSIPLAI
jgi:hypothetical protein